MKGRRLGVDMYVWMSALVEQDEQMSFDAGTRTRHNNAIISREPGRVQGLAVRDL